MSAQPPVPEGNVTPFPKHEPPHHADAVPEAAAGKEEALEGQAVAAAREHRAAQSRAQAQRGSRVTFAAGAAVGIGSAALVAALLYGRSGGRKHGVK